MYRLLAIASTLLVLVATTSALTVVETSKTATNGRGIVGQTATMDNACCADYPFCGCPKLEPPQAVTTTQKKRLFVKLPPAKQPVTAKSESPCCPDYPFCGCPKLESPQAAKTKKLYVKLPPAKQTARAKSDSPCCADYPFCGCPKLEVPSKKPRFKVINVGAAAKSRSKVSPLMVRRPPKELVTATSKGTNSCCPDYPACSCPKL